MGNLLLDEIEWGEPILPAVNDPAWEAEAKRRVGRVGEVDRRVAGNPWIREACVALSSYRPSQVPPHMGNIGGLVIAQENSCRYCYGANRAYLKIMGYSEAFIRQLEHDVDVAELDVRESAAIAFCRNLARAKPRPAKAALEHLVELGYSRAAVSEMAFHISAACFYNRIGVLTACPPERAFERLANGPIGRVVGVVTPLVRQLTTLTWQRRPLSQDDELALASGPFGRIVSALAGLPAANLMKSALDGAFASPVVSHAAKALMFAIVGRTLDCSYSEGESRRLLGADHYELAEIDAAILTLRSARLPPHESALLSWVRDTVHYQTPVIQARTRAIVSEIGPVVALEAIGVAALANATVRLAMLLE
jgi:alkylhydroperoxidase family enzyme